jgi:hypothetical protein
MLVGASLPHVQRAGFLASLFLASEGARQGWPAARPHRNTHTSLRTCIKCSCVLGWAVRSLRSTGLTAVNVPRVPAACTACLYGVRACPAYSYVEAYILRAKYGSDLGFRSRSMRIIIIEAPQSPASPAFSQRSGRRGIYVEFRRTALKRTREGDDAPDITTNPNNYLSIGPPGFNGLPHTRLCGTCNL